MRPVPNARYVAVVILMLLLVGCGNNSQPKPAPSNIVPKFAYVTNNNPFPYPSSISGFGVDANTGALTSVPGSPFATQDYPISMALHPTGKFLYTTSPGVNFEDPNSMGSIGGYNIDSNSGALTAIAGSPFPTGANAVAVAVHTSGSFLYVGSHVESHLFYGGSIYGYTIEKSTGVLSQISGSPFPSGHLPASIAQDPSGKFLYVADVAADQVLAYSIDQVSGSLALIADSPIACPEPTSVLADPKGGFVFAANSPGGAGTVSAYAMDHDSGALSAVSGSPFGGAGPNPLALAVDPKGRLLYAANYAGTVSGYQINSAGALTTISGSPFPVGQSLSSIVVDPSGKFVYVTDGSLKQVFGFMIGTDGSLTAISGSPFGLSGNPSAIVVLGSSQ